jgi:hypothetical protein
MAFSLFSFFGHTYNICCLGKLACLVEGLTGTTMVLRIRGNEALACVTACGLRRGIADLMKMNARLQRFPRKLPGHMRLRT